MSGEDTMKQLNGSAEPLTESQVKEHQEKYGRNELVEGKKKTVLQIFLEQYKDRYTYVHTKDFALSKMGDTWESRPICFAPVGEGNLNWAEILDVCKRNNVQSYAIEQDDCYGRDPFDCVESSFNYLMKIGVND